MTTDTSGFREFEQAGWADEALARQYAAWFGSLTTQCIPALLDAVGAHRPAITLTALTYGLEYFLGMRAEYGSLRDTLAESRYCRGERTRPTLRSHWRATRAATSRYAADSAGAA